MRPLKTSAMPPPIRLVQPGPLWCSLSSPSECSLPGAKPALVSEFPTKVVLIWSKLTGAVASADAASAEVTGVVVLSEQAAAITPAPAMRRKPRIFFMCLSKIFVASSSGFRKPSWKTRHA